MFLFSFIRGALSNSFVTEIRIEGKLLFANCFFFKPTPSI